MVCSIIKWNIRQYINDRRNCHKKDATESNRLAKIINNIRMLNTIRLTAWCLAGNDIFTVSAIHMQEEQYTQTYRGINSGPLTGPAKPHCNTAKSKRYECLLQLCVVKTLLQIAVHEVIRQHNKQCNKHIDRRYSCLHEMHKVKRKQ